MVSTILVSFFNASANVDGRFNLQNNSIMVLCIEERDEPRDYKLIDNRMFVFWEEISERYMVYGRRQDQGNFSGVPYAFGFESSKEVCDFLRLLLEKRQCSMTYYNYNNLCYFVYIFNNYLCVYIIYFYVCQNYF